MHHIDLSIRYEQHDQHPNPSGRAVGLDECMHGPLLKIAHDQMSRQSDYGCVSSLVFESGETPEMPDALEVRIFGRFELNLDGTGFRQSSHEVPFVTTTHVPIPFSSGQVVSAVGQQLNSLKLSLVRAILTS